MVCCKKHKRCYRVRRSGFKPVALSEAEMERLGIQNVVVQIDFEVGDSVVITSGAWKDTESVIQSINEAKRTVTINVEMMGRETPLEIGFAESKEIVTKVKGP